MICALSAGCSEPPPTPYIDLGEDDPDVGTVPDMGTPSDISVADTSVADMNGLSDSGTTDEGTVGPNPGQFDPDLVYIFDWVPYQSTSVPVINDFDGATRSIPGFEGVTFFEGVIRPTDGRIVYGDPIGFPTGVNVFVEDAWSSGDYPNDPEANDISVSVPRCGSVNAIGVEPGTGDILYECLDCPPDESSCYGNVFRSGGGAYLTVGATSGWWPGYNGATLYDQGNAIRLRAGGVTTTITTQLSDLEDVVAVRATLDGFLVVSREGSSLHAFLIDTDGSVSPEGSYPLHPGYDRPSHYRLAANGDLYLIVEEVGSITGYRSVLRLVIGAVDPVVLLFAGADHRTSLITGP